ncbi:hypothetical protein J5N97_005003 [Dioscorea zingiberensis]|uniref:Uncharacterized protein n=1 Tax=Dioscorea zingiberensis TaxID=325984 RepID=A0A9D5D913_9LILI|nr:hypothetical protein J5N97_005003 [Dioscorea zingiberensis]
MHKLLKARCSDLEAKINISGKKAIQGLHEAEEDVEKLKEEAEANKNYMLQYKEIAQTNENALKQIECAHEEYKAEAERLKKALEAEVLSLKNKISEIESFYVSKSEEANRAMEDKEKALSSTRAEKSSLNEEIAEKFGYASSVCVQNGIKIRFPFELGQETPKALIVLQLESALKASETAQALLNSQRENSRAALLKEEEEFKSLQFQLGSFLIMVLFAPRNSIEESQKAKMETRKISSLLREKQIELDSCQKVVEMQKVEIGHLQSRIAELHENCKNIDVGEYERMKDDLHQLKVKSGESDTQLHLTKNLVSEKQELISSLEENLAKCQSKLAEQEKKLADALQAEANIRQETEKQRRIINHWKKKHDILLKEKEELTKENQALLKQLDDSKSSRRAIIDNASELAMKEKEEKDKEKDTRIQILEKTLERERDENKKEKTKRLKTEKTMVDLIENEKKKVEDELAKHKHAIVNVLENSGITASRLPDGSALDEQTSTYFQLIDNLETSAKSFLQRWAGNPTNVMETTSPVGVPITTTGPVVTHQLKLASPHEGAEERDKRIVSTKPITEVRKAGRKIVRPSLEWSGETSIDIEMSGVEGSATEEGRALSSHESEPSGVASVPNQPSSSRKRAASSSVSELREAIAPDETSDEVNLFKRPRESEPMQEAGDEQATPLSAEDSDASRQLVPPPMDISDTQPPVDGPEADQVFASPTEAEIMDTGKPEEMEVSTKVEIEGQKMTLDGINQDEPQHESDSNTEDAEKARVATDSLDDALKIEENDVLQPADDSEDAREEGELILDESEQTQQQEDPSPVECAHDSVSGDGGVNAYETGEISEVVAVSNEKCEGTNIVEDLADTSDKPTGNNNDQNASDFERSPQPPSRAREGSPSNVTASSVTEPQSAISASESEEPRTGESLTQRASRNAALRLAGIATRPPSAGPRKRC